jgi:signal transduction histidine kinase
MNLQRLLRWTLAGQLPESCLEPLEISLKEVERLNASVTGVLQMSRAGEGPREVVGLHDVLGEATELLGSRFEMQGVGLNLDLDADADFVLARPGQLKSVALNLMMNALEAQPDGGELTIKTALVGSPEIGGPAISIRFQDQGPGVPFGLRERIFEPFFTAKDGGSGIGLAMAKQAVEDSGGKLLLAPPLPPQAGAEFVMLFPLASFDASRGDVSSTGPRYATASVRPAPFHYHLDQASLGPDELPPGEAQDSVGGEAATPPLPASKSETVN